MPEASPPPSDIPGRPSFTRPPVAVPTPAAAPRLPVNRAASLRSGQPLPPPCKRKPPPTLSPSEPVQILTLIAGVLFSLSLFLPTLNVTYGVYFLGPGGRRETLAGWEVFLEALVTCIHPAVFTWWVASVLGMLSNSLLILAVWNYRRVLRRGTERVFASLLAASALWVWFIPCLMETFWYEDFIWGFFAWAIAMSLVGCRGLNAVFIRSRLAYRVAKPRPLPVDHWPADQTGDWDQARRKS